MQPASAFPMGADSCIGGADWNLCEGSNLYSRTLVLPVLDVIIYRY